jgi:cytoskeleton protein RodZ
MSPESFQETLFEDPLGLRFRHAREKLRWSQEAVAQQTKLSVAVIEAIEREDWARLGAPIYVRSYISSYARLVGLPASLADDVVRHLAPPDLKVDSGASGGRRAIDRGLLSLGYLAMTVVILGAAAMLALRFQQDAPAPADTTAALPLRSAAVATPVNAAPSPATATPGAASEAPVLASLAPSLPVENRNDLVLRFRAESWIDAIDAGGRLVERGLVPAGSERRFQAGQIGRITLGDATAVDVAQGGRPVDLAPFRTANVARFAVSSAGELTIVGE